MLNDNAKPWFVGKGVKLWRRPDFVPGGVPFQAFVVDYRDGMLEVIALDLPGCRERKPSEYGAICGDRRVVPLMAFGGIQPVDDDELKAWCEAADYRLHSPRPVFNLL